MKVAMAFVQNVARRNIEDVPLVMEDSDGHHRTPVTFETAIHILRHAEDPSRPSPHREWHVAMKGKLYELNSESHKVRLKTSRGTRSLPLVESGFEIADDLRWGEVVAEVVGSSEYAEHVVRVVSIRKAAPNDPEFSMILDDDAKIALGPWSDRLRVLGDLGAEWDSYGAKPVDKVAMRSADDLVKSLLRRHQEDDFGFQVPFATPAADGRVVLEWEIGDECLHIHVMPGGGVEYLLVSEGVSREDACSFADAVMLARTFLRRHR